MIAKKHGPINSFVYGPCSILFSFLCGASITVSGFGVPQIQALCLLTDPFRESDLDKYLEFSAILFCNEEKIEASTYSQREAASTK